MSYNLCAVDLSSAADLLPRMTCVDPVPSSCGSQNLGVYLEIVNVS